MGAIETCERLFRGMPLRTSTENIGIARHREGLELVRIGEPAQQEFAAWRYGDQFGRRMRRYVALGVGAGAASLAFVNAPGAIVLGSWWAIMILSSIRTSAKVRVGPPAGARRSRQVQAICH